MKLKAIAKTNHFIVARGLNRSYFVVLQSDNIYTLSLTGYMPTKVDGRSRGIQRG